jgi:hypothetical protein
MTAPETAVASGLMIGGLLLAMMLFTTDPNAFRIWARSVSPGALHCPAGTILSIVELKCSEIPRGDVTLTLNQGDKFTLPPGENGYLQVESGGVKLDNRPQYGTLSYFSPALPYMSDRDHAEITEPNTRLVFRPD